MPVAREITVPAPRRVPWGRTGRLLLGGAWLIFTTGAPAQAPVPSPPVAADVELEIPASPVSVYDDVTFKVRLANPARPNEWQVVFGDGSASEWSTGPVVTHRYKDVGQMKVYALFSTVKGASRQVRSQSRTQTLQVDPPREDLAPVSAVKLTASTSHLLAGQSVDFQITLPEGGTLGEYTFRSGEGRMHQAQNSAAFSHRYESTGKFWASVTLPNPKKQVSDEVELTVDQPGIGLEVDAAEVNEGDSVRFTAHGPAREIPNLLYRFDFGDQQHTGWTYQAGAEHKYPGNGSYTATVELGTLEGKQAKTLAKSAPVTVTVQVQTTVALEWSPPEIEVDQAVQFEAKPRNAPNVLLGYRFQFGDGAASEVTKSPVVKYHYETPGWQSPVVEVGSLRRGSNGLVLGKIFATSPGQRLWVKKLPGIILKPQAVQTRAGDLVNFQAEMSDGSVVVGFQFDPGDGTPVAEIKGGQVAHAYPTGRYTARASQKRSQSEVTVAVRALTTGERLSSGWRQTPMWLQWLFVVVGALAAMAVGRKLHRWWRPHVTIRPRGGPPPKFLPGPKPPAIVFSVRLSPHLNRATCRFDHGPAGLIQSEQIHHD